MKSIFTATLLTLFSLFAAANPKPSTYARISELYFDIQGKWFLEVQYYHLIDERPVDSIQITTHSGKSLAIHPSVVYSDQFFSYLLLTSDSLKSPLTINPSGDSVGVRVVISNTSDYFFKSALVYGNFPGAIIGAPVHGQSIAWLNDDDGFSKDNSPNLGLENDSLGMMGTVKGKVLNADNSAVSSISFLNLLPSEQLIPYFTTDAGGNFTFRQAANNSIIYNIYYLNPGLKEAKLENVSISMEPDSLVEVILHLKKNITGIKDMEGSSPLFRFYPNPLDGSRELNYEIDLPVNSADLRLTVLNMEGRLIYEKKISESKGSIKLPSLEKGVYLLHITLNKQVCFSTRILTGDH